MAHDRRRDHRTDFGTFIAIHREHCGETGTSLGAAVGVSQTVYSNWERSKALPKDVTQVQALARKLRLDEDLLIGIWQRTREDVAKDGPAIIMSKYAVTSNGGRTPQEPYRPRGRITA
jgi:transcriptional regulator with XRE-family HTH domain